VQSVLMNTGRVLAERLQRDWEPVGHRMGPEGLVQERALVLKAGSIQSCLWWWAAAVEGPEERPSEG
jgi:hypothetical protein